MLWTRIFAVWLGIAVLMMLRGTLREAFATPALGELRAHQLAGRLRDLFSTGATQ